MIKAVYFINFSQLEDVRVVTGANDPIHRLSPIDREVEFTRREMESLSEEIRKNPSCVARIDR